MGIARVNAITMLSYFGEDASVVRWRNSFLPLLISRFSIRCSRSFYDWQCIGPVT
jgi:hypothetical protein